MESVEDFHAALRTLQLDQCQRGSIDAERLRALERALDGRAAFMAPRALLTIRTQLERLQESSPPVRIALPEVHKITLARDDTITPSASLVPRPSEKPQVLETLVYGVEGEHIERRGVIPALSIANCRNCLFKLGACAGALSLEDVNDCIIHVACHQLRLSRCTNIKVFLHVATNVTMEDSSEIAISELEPWYDNLMSDIALAGLGGENQCKSIVDFTNI